MISKLILSSILIGLSFGAGTGNPFEGAVFFPNPDYAKEVQTSIQKHPSEASIMKIAAQQSAAFWMDTMAHIPVAGQFLEAAGESSKKTSQTTLVTLIVYDVPDRDCSAGASAGEFKCSNSACTDGINDYKTKYIAPIVTMLKNYTSNYPKLRIVLIIEPDSLPNLATNLNVPECSQAQTAYKTCIAYAIQTLSPLSDNIWLYIDAAHGGWLGWQDNMQKFGAVIKEVLTMAGGNDLIRGFADNVANYQWLGSIDNKDDPCNFKSQYNMCNNEAVYMSKMNDEFVNALGQSFYWVHDSGRNGVEDARTGTTACSNWCNIKGAGLGYKPTTNVSFTGIEDMLDALFWLKTPGESDGTTNSSSPYFDDDCVSANALQPAPLAGDWFDTDFDMLAKNSIWQS